MAAPFVPALIAAGSQLLGGIWQNAQQRSSAREQMRFQERMSSTSHQREVRDLRAAGINPALTVGGGGASTPSGGQANISDAVGPGVSSALQATLLRKQLQVMGADYADKNASAALKGSQISLTNAQRMETFSRTMQNLGALPLQAAQAANARSQGELLKGQASLANLAPGVRLLLEAIRSLK